MEAVGDARFRDAIKVPGTSFSVLRKSDKLRIRTLWPPSSAPCLIRPYIPTHTHTHTHTHQSGTEAVSDAKVKGATSLLLAVPLSALVTVEGDGVRCLDAISQRSQGPNSVSNMAEERSASMEIVRRLRGGGHFIVQRWDFMVLFLISCRSWFVSHFHSAWRWRPVQTRRMQPRCNWKGTTLQSTRRWCQPSFQHRCHIVFIETRGLLFSLLYLPPLPAPKSLILG